MTPRAISGVLVVDKPRGLSSHDVVQLARRALGTRTVGHAGTLDPLATGVLVLGVGEGTKLLRYLTDTDKSYSATLRLGVATDSLDSDGRVVQTAAVPSNLDLETVSAAAAPFVGEHLQVAPVVSAIKRDGVALYERVRRGEDVVAPERRVVLRQVEIISVGDAEIELHVHVGKGFYVRAFGRDLAFALGTVGHLVALRRESSGGFDLAQALPAAWLRQARTDEAARARVLEAMLPLSEALPQAPRVKVDDAGVIDARHGRVITASRVVTGEVPAGEVEPVLVLDAHDTPIVLARAREGRLEVVRGLHV